jgi:RND family efflux transporter MFP subunit
MESKMDVLKQQFDMTRIKSPIDGTVDEVSIKIGQSVAPGVPAIRVVNLSSLKVQGEVAESFISRVKKGNPVILYFPDDNKKIKTVIGYSGSRIDPLNRTFNVEVRLSDKEGILHPNMIAVMKIVDYTNPQAIIVPVSAVQKSTDGEFVYVISREGGKLIAKRKIVNSGLIYDGFTEIKSGLESGDEVVTNGFQNIIEGDAVKI